jgi:hypothetical protein
MIDITLYDLRHFLSTTAVTIVAAKLNIIGNSKTRPSWRFRPFHQARAPCNPTNGKTNQHHSTQKGEPP